MESSFMMIVVYIFIFLFGIALIRLGLERATPARVKTMIYTSTSHPLLGFIVGFAVTATLQSSTAVMVLAVSLVAAGLIPFRQTIAIILGANVGTTITLEILVLSGETLGIIALALGFVCLLSRYRGLFLFGMIFSGIGCMFLAMDGMGNWGQNLATTSILQAFLNQDFSNLSSLLGGTVIASIIQSSTATIAIAIQLYANDLLNLNEAISIMMGSNVGTCLTAVIAAIGAGRGAMQTAMANVVLNLGGALLFLPFVGFFSDIVMHLTSDPAAQVAHASVIFNLVCSLVLLPFIHPFATLIERMTGGRV
ncbi:Na/Pi symporter [Geomicrobium sediminis]|uniref:Phosphate:Na+ symporter n=1 Tax=Geomicrobium sediminis TaxID=1347788 RepID=A0ABS2PG12_9BACL|nr:Na/Pi symporter [Geomicrobium sediminis]MBM7633763.1 phosphate:Na+ symporter [Geomicrobium sediminis]